MAVPEVIEGQIFPWGVLAATTLMEGRARVEGAGARAKCNLTLLLCSVAITILSGDKVQEVGAGALRELGFSRTSPPCGWDLRPWGCTSVLVSLFLNVLALVKG